MKKALFITLFLFFSSQLFAQTLKTVIDNNITNQGNRGITALKLKNSLYALVDSINALKNRGTHNGLQSIETISGLQDSLVTKTNNLILTNNYLKSDGYIENKGYLIEFLKSLYDYNTTPTNQNIGIAWYGDSVAPDVGGEFYMGLEDAYPLNNLNCPAGIRSGIGVSTTGVVKYALKNAGEGYQNNNNGLLSATITRSGSTATLTSAQAHFLTTAKYVTISGASQTEYNGTFAVTSVPTSTTATFTVSGTPTSPATGTITCYGGLTDYTYLPSASHIELANAATITYDAGQNAGFEKFRLFFAKDNTSGSAFIELLAENGTTVVSSSTISLSNSTLTAIHTDVTVPDANVKYKIRITATGKVVSLGCYPLRNAGITSVTLSFGGSAFTQNNYSSDAILDYLVTNLNIKLLFIQAKEDGFPSVLTPLANRLNRYVNTSKIVVGSLPDASGDATLTSINSYFRTLALANKCVYVDGQKFFDSKYQNLVNASLQGDGTHVALNANKAVANTIISEYNLLNLKDKVSRLKIDQRGNAAASTNILSSINISSPNPTSSIPFVFAYGGSDATKVVVDNVREYRFAQSPSAYTYLGGYTTEGVGVFTKSGARNGILYSGGIYTQNSSFSIFDNLVIRGYDGGNTFAMTGNNNLTLSTSNGSIRLNTTSSSANHFSIAATTGNVGIGTATAVASAALEINSNSKGFLPPRMTATEASAIASPAQGLMLYVTNTNGTFASVGWWGYNGSAWEKMNN